MKTLKIGLTGGIGSGKTTVARIVSQKLRYPVYIADETASRLIRDRISIRNALIRHFGKHVYLPDRSLNKKWLADRIFTDPSALQAVNRIVHPEVLKDFHRWSERQQGKLIFFESAILFEAGLDAHFDYIVCITASLDTRIARVVQRDGTTPEKVRERIRNQIDEQKKCRMSDYVICTDQGVPLLRQLFELEKQLKKKYLWQNTENG